MQPNNCGSIFEKSTQMIYTWPIASPNELIESAEPIAVRFYSDYCKNDEWHVKLYPKGTQGNSDECDLSIKFVSRENNQVDADCTVTLRKPPVPLNARTPSHSFSKVFQNGQVHVMGPFLTRAMMIDPINLSPDGSCMIRFVIHSRIHTDPASPSRDTSSGFPEHCLINNLSVLLNNPKMTDVTINVGDAHYPAHKVILAARSPIFSAMFEETEASSSQASSNPSNQININDFTPEIIKEMLKYIYTDQMDISEENVRDLFVAATKYGLEDLKLKCANFIFGFIDKNNAAEILILADRMNATKLKNETVTYIDDHLAEIMETAGWPNLEDNHPGLVRELLRHSAKRPRRI